MAPAAYASFMGRFSEPLAQEFADAAGVEPGQRVSTSAAVLAR